MKKTLSVERLRSVVSEAVTWRRAATADDVEELFSVKQRAAGEPDLWYDLEPLASAALAQSRFLNPSGKTAAEISADAEAVEVLDRGSQSERRALKREMLKLLASGFAAERAVAESARRSRLREAASHDALSDALSDMESAARACRALSLPGDSGAEVSERAPQERDVMC